METVEVVIRLPEKTYRKILSNEYDYGDMNVIIQAGTPLPKGHGRLIDADAINIHDVSPAYGMEVYGVTQDDIEYEPTVIEADREVQDEK